MSVTRRAALVMGGGAFLASLAGARPGQGSDVVDIAMAGGRNGAHVWFNPVGIHVAPGQVVRWTNRDAGNSHTATAYHPALSDHPLRIPEGAEPWNSGYLLPEETFSVTLVVPGVYDYYCVPHEQAGMVGRIVVGEVEGDPYGTDDATLPEAALRGFPPVAEILARGVVQQL